ncbi:MFS transporter [Paenibacillus sp. J5C_2022]|uniref:MDR family MFS transporter n=1 Tax=Paenibacillus sp. J5C2022 TaxID=2977129 RepID=UPI0021CF5F76|nr:MDR family MFS transporter [Paenibacillus sp. J5C2022]MCU6708127.1 MFS transporter [Paenibacillus sp. J5C2022]
MEHLSNKRKITIMLAIMSAMFFAAINQTIVGTAMPRIIAELGGMQYYSWVITIYLLTSTIATVMVGKLSDMYGRKPFMLIGIVIFIIGGLLTGFSKDIAQLIIYRGVQGIGAGIIMASVFTAVGDLFSPRERGKWTGILMAVFGFSSMIGPALGGWIVEHMPWSWLFWIFLPIGLIAFVMILFLFPKVDQKSNERIDYAGSIFLSLTIIALLTGFSLVGSGDDFTWTSPEIIALFAATIVFLIIFIMVERKASSPVLPLSLFRNDIVVISNIIAFIINAGMIGALIYIPFFIQGVEGVSPSHSGYVTMPMSFAMVVVSAVVGRVITKTGKYKRYGIIGLPIMIGGMLVMANMTEVWHAVTAMTVFGIGLGLSMPIFTLTVQNAVSPRELGVATSSSQLFRSVGGTIGIAVLGSIMQSRMVKEMQEQAAAAGGGGSLEGMDPKVAEALAPLQSPEILLNQPELEKLLHGLPEAVRPIANGIVEMVRTAMANSLSTVFLVGAGLVVVAFVLVFFLREIPLRTSNQVPGQESGEAAERTPDKMPSNMEGAH